MGTQPLLNMYIMANKHDFDTEYDAKMSDLGRKIQAPKGITAFDTEEK